MGARISKWGNSLAVRLPRAVLDQLGLQEGQEIEFVIKDGEVQIKPAHKRPTLKELVAEMERIGLENAPPFEDWGILPSEWPPYEKTDGPDKESD